MTGSYQSQGAFLVQASTASSRDGKVVTHPKLDLTTFQFAGRSYGVGASVGLHTPTDVKSFQYFEDGYLTSVECMTNNTLPAQLNLVFNATAYDASNTILPSVWAPSGYLPNSDVKLSTDLLGISLSGNYSVFGVLGSSNAGRFMYRMVPGRGYTMFQDMQCELFFTPARFNVSVDVVNGMIQVAPFENSTHYDVDPTGVIKVQTFQQLWAFAAMDSTQLNSIVGRAFVTNVANVAQAHGSPIPGPQSEINAELANGATTDAIRYQGVAEAIESIVDNSLLAFGLTQVLVANDTAPSSLQAVASAVRFGTPGYTYAVFAMAMLTTVVYLVELALTRCWKRVEAFDISDMKTSIIGASAGGTQIANAAGRSPNTPALRGSNDGASDDESADNGVSGTVQDPGVMFAAQSMDRSTVVDGSTDGGSLRVSWKRVYRGFALCLVQEERSPLAVPPSSWDLQVPGRAFSKRSASVTARPLMSSENSEETIGLTNRDEWRQH